MTADAFEVANILSILLAARRPEWVDHPVPGLAATTGTGAPATSAFGVQLKDSPRTLALIDLRREVHRRTVAITVPVVDLSGTYRITVDATNSDYATAAPADLAELLVQWQDSINADGGVNAVVLAEALDTDGDGNVDTLFITGRAEANYNFGLAVTVGTGEILGTADARTGTARTWFTAKLPNAPTGILPTTTTWRVSNNGVYPLNRRGFLERADTAGLDRLYVEIFDIAGTGDVAGAQASIEYFARVTIGPSIDERLAG